MSNDRKKGEPHISALLAACERHGAPQFSAMSLPGPSWSPPEDKSEEFQEAYRQGYQAGREGGGKKNPYPESGHERETTYEDELHYQWYSGHMAGQKDKPESPS